MRTDDDSWDITTSVGATALLVAAARALEAAKPDPLAVDPYAEVFCHAAGGVWAELLDGRDKDVSAANHELRTEFGVHFVTFQGARTRFFDRYLTRAVDAGIRQIVIPAAGLDSRAYRFPWPDGTVVYEIDQPGVLEFKRSALRGRTARAQRREIAADLRGNWTGALLDAGFDRFAPAAWLVEGLLLYLPAGAQERLFEDIDQLSAAGSRMAVEEVIPTPPEVFEALRAEEVAAGEEGHFYTLIYNERCPADDWFAGRGWTTATAALSDIFDRLGRSLPDPDSPARPMIQASRLVTGIKAGVPSDEVTVRLDS